MRKVNKIKVRGEMFHCRNCKKVKVIKYLIPLKVSWSKDELKIQENFSMREMAPDYNSEKEGYYKHSYGICEECVQADEKGIILSKNHLLLRYWKAVSTFEKRANQIKNSFINEYIMQISKIATGKINYKRFIKWKETKHRGYLDKEDKINLEKLVSFFEKMGESEKDKKLIKLKEKIISSEKDATDFMESQDDIITYYILNDKRHSLNLRPIDMKRMALVCPNKGLTFGKFYNSGKYSKKVFVKDLKDKERFNVIREGDLDEVLNWLSLTLQGIMKLLS